MARAKKKDKHVLVRMPEDLHQRLMAVAHSHNPPLSLNSTIVTLLKDSVAELEAELEGDPGIALKMSGLTRGQMGELEKIFKQWKWTPVGGRPKKK